MSDKRSLRASCRERRRAISESSQRLAAKDLAKQLQSLREFRSVKTVGMYLASDGEIDLGIFMNWCWDKQLLTCVPLINKQTKVLGFSLIDRNTALVRNRLGILEPEAGEGTTLSIDMLEILLMPLVAFDDHGNRLGMGGGFYDATLKANQDAGGRQPVRIGVAHEIQRLQKIEPDPWDVPLDLAVTDVCIRRYCNS